MPAAVVQKFGADGEVRQDSLRTATDTSAERGRTGVVGFKTVVLYVFVSRAAVDDLMYRDNRQP